MRTLWEKLKRFCKINLGFFRFIICYLVLSSSCTMTSKEELKQASNHIDLEKLSVNPENFILINY